MVHPLRGHFEVDGKTTPHLQPGDAVKYLGVLVGADGRKESYGCHLGKRAERVEGGTYEATAAGVHLRSAPCSETATQLVLEKVYMTQLAPWTGPFGVLSGQQ